MRLHDPAGKIQTDMVRPVHCPEAQFAIDQVSLPGTNLVTGWCPTHCTCSLFCLDIVPVFSAVSMCVSPSAGVCLSVPVSVRVFVPT